jgi:hypothetical protein
MPFFRDPGEDMTSVIMPRQTSKAITEMDERSCIGAPVKSWRSKPTAVCLG